jgi:hypothetical protein
MADGHTMDPADWLGKQLQAASPDLLREIVTTFVAQLMNAEAEALCGAGYGERSEDRTNSRNGYRAREWDTRAGTIELAIPKLRSGSYFPDWLLDRRRRAEQALISVVATSYLLGVSTRRVDKLVEALGISGISKSQVSRMAKVLDVEVEAFRTRPLDAGPYTYVWMDALTQKVREGGRVVQVAVVIANGVNADGQREILGLDLITTEDGAGWLGFLRSLVARGLHGVKLVVSDAHQGPRRRDRGHPARRRLAALPHPLCEQPAGQDPQACLADGRRDAAQRLRTARCRSRAPPVPRALRRPGRQVRRGTRTTRGSRDRGARLHRVSRRTLEADPIQQPTRAPEQGDTAPHRRRRHLPRPRRRDPPRRRRPRRATRGMGLRPALHQRRITSQNKAVSHRRRRPPRKPTGGDPRTQRSAVT